MDGMMTPRAFKGGAMRVFSGLMVSALLAGSAGCGVLDSDASERLEDLPGVRAAALDKFALDTDYYGYSAVADMEPDATAPQIATALDELARWTRSHKGDDASAALYLGAGTTAYDMESWGSGGVGGGPTAVISATGSHAENLANAGLLIAATHATKLPVTITDGEWHVTSEAPRATAAVIATHPDLANVPDLVVAPRMLMDHDGFGAPAALGSSSLTPALLAMYDRAVANADLVRESQGEGKAAVSYAGNSSSRALGETFDEETGKEIVPPAGAVSIQVTLRLPEGAGPKTLAPRLADDPRWPMIRAQLDLLRKQPRGSGLWVWLEFTRDGIPYEAGRSVIEVANGVELPQLARTPWNLEAQRYLDAAYLAR